MFFLIVLCIFLRIWVFFNFQAGYDAEYYIQLGKSISERGDLYLPFGDTEADSLEPAQSTYYGRLAFPIYLPFFYTLFGFNYFITKLAATILSIFTLLVVYLITKNLFGKDNALVVTSIVSMISILITNTGIIYAENMGFLLFAIGLWGLLKGGKFFPIGIVSISTAFISKSNSWVAYLLFICLFYCWLYYSKRKKVLDKYHIIGLVCTIPFAILLYISRSYSTLLTHRTSILDAIMGDPLYMVTRYLQLLLFVLVYTLGFAIYFIKPLKKSFSTKNLLWVVVVFFLLGFPFFLAYQDFLYQQYQGNLRKAMKVTFYITLPILWLAIPKIKYNLDEKLRISEIWHSLKNRQELRSNLNLFILTIVLAGAAMLILREFWIVFPALIGLLSLLFSASKWKIAILCLMLVFVGVNDNTGIRYDHRKALGEDMNELLEDGDVVMLDGIDFIRHHNGTSFHRYILAPYVTKDYVVINFDSNETPDYIITQNYYNSWQNYTVLKEYYTQGRRGIITQIIGEIQKAVKDQPEREILPVYILWGKE